MARNKDQKSMSKEELLRGTKELLQSYDHLQKSDCDKVKLLKQDLLLLASSVYPDDDVDGYLYGSRMTGLARKGTDVDIYLDIGGTFEGSISEDSEEQAKRVERFRDAMLRDEQKKKFQVVLALTGCRVPILKFKHIGTDLNGDLSFRSGMSTRNSELVKFYLDWDPRVKYVVTGVKYFMEEYGLAESNGFNSYSQVWLALFFLMQPGIELIPSLLCFRILATQTGPPVTQSMVEYWDCTVPIVDGNWRNKWIKKKCPVLSGEELLVKFFTFYSSLPSVEHEFVLTAYNGMKTKKKKVFFKSRKPIRRFYDTYRREKGTKEFVTMKKKYSDDIDERFYLQDPFHQLKNLTKMSSAKTSRDQMAIFVEYCKQMALTLK